MSSVRRCSRRAQLLASSRFRAPRGRRADSRGGGAGPSGVASAMGEVKQLNAAEFFEKNCQIAGFDNVRPLLIK